MLDVVLNKKADVKRRSLDFTSELLAFHRGFCESMYPNIWVAKPNMSNRFFIFHESPLVEGYFFSRSMSDPNTLLALPQLVTFLGVRSLKIRPCRIWTIQSLGGGAQRSFIC